MARITQIKVPNDNTTYNLSIPFIIGTGTTAGTWLGSLENLTAYYDGLMFLYKPSVAGASTTTLNINSLGAKTVYVNNTTKLTTHFPANQPIVLVYSASQNSGCWMCIDNYYASNTHRPIQMNGTQILGNNTTPLNLVAGDNITLTNDGGAVTFEPDITPVRSVETPCALATFEGAALPMPKLKVSVEAKQDLHGYDKPWVGGAGKNKAESVINDWSNKGITATKNDDGSYSITGTATESVTSAFLVNVYPVSDGEQYIVTNKKNQADTATKYTRCVCSFYYDSTYKSEINVSEGQTITVPSNANRLRLSYVWNGGFVVPASAIIYPMLRLATETDATFAPYSNICPISGWDAVVVSDVGKNLFPILIGNDVWLNNAGSTHTTSNGVLIINPSSSKISSGVYSALNSEMRKLITTLKGEYVYSFEIKGNKAASVTCGITDHNNIARSVSTDWVRYEIPTTFSGGETVGCVFYNYSMTEDLEIQVRNFMIERGSSATSYEPYNPDSYTTTISLGQTVYYGEIDVINGVLTVKWIKPDLSQLSYLKSPSGLFYTESVVGTIKKPLATARPTGFIKSSIFNEIDSNSISGPTGTTPSPNGVMALNTAGRLYFNYTDTTDIDTFKSDMANVDFIYELAEPIIINLTPSLIKSLNGQNNLSVDCGEVLELHYVRPEYDEMTAKIAEKAGSLMHDAGSATNPVYFNNGVPTACTYELNATVPSNAVFTDTKNTAGSTNTSSKIFLIGATSQASNPKTYSDNEVYAANGVLTTKSVQVGGGAVTLQYNSTTQSLDFVFI